jgi:hypothetical protein
MASRMMHLIIGEKVASRLGMPADPQFLLGSIAADAVYVRADKKRSHYYKGSGENRTLHVDITAFLTKYDACKHQPFLLGYLTHLISDEVWLNDIYFTNNLHMRHRSNHELIVQGHDDFRILNSKLVMDYKCAWLRDLLAQTPVDDCPVDEIATHDLLRFKEETVEDFTFEPESCSKPLFVYDYEQIARYLEHAADAAEEACKGVSG